MKLLILLIYNIAILFSRISVCYGAREVDLFAAGVAAYEAFSDGFSCIGNSFISFGRILSYDWLRTGRHLFNFQFALNNRDADYFFYKEQKARDQRLESLKRGRRRSLIYYGKTFIKGEVAERYEFYCENPDPISLRNYCAWALRNKKLAKKLSWRMNLNEEPRCEFKKVYLERYKFTSRRTFLRCPVMARQKDSEHESYVYITSVENAPINRLLLFVFMSFPKDAPLLSRQSSESRSVDYSASEAEEREEYSSTQVDLGRINEIEEEDSQAIVVQERRENTRKKFAPSRTLSIQDSKPDTPNFQRKRSSLLERSSTMGDKKEADRTVLKPITLLINKRHTLDLKNRTPYYESVNDD